MLSFVENLFEKKNTWQDSLVKSECNNFNQWEKECHVIYNPPYDYKFQLKTTFMSRKSIAAKLGNSKLVGQTWGKFTVAANFSVTFSLTLDSC